MKFVNQIGGCIKKAGMRAKSLTTKIVVFYVNCTGTNQ